MRTFLRKLLFLCFIIGAWDVHSQTLTLATDDTPGDPFIIGGGSTFDETKPGIEIEMYRAIASKLGMTLELKRLPWNRALLMLEQGQVDGLFPASFKLERTLIGHYPMQHAIVDISRRSRTNGYHLYKLADSTLDWDGSTFLNLNEQNLAAHQGWSIVDDLQKMGVNVVEIPAHAKAPELLLNKRVGGFVALETVFDAYIKKHPEALKEIVKVFPPVREKNYYLLFSKQFYEKQTETAERFWDEIKAFQQSEPFSALVENYID
jgi:polar amino acid transport system substrate-binding protein